MGNKTISTSLKQVASRPQSLSAYNYYELNQLIPFIEVNVSKAKDRVDELQEALEPNSNYEKACGGAMLATGLIIYLNGISYLQTGINANIAIFSSILIMACGAESLTQIFSEPILKYNLHQAEKQLNKMQMYENTAKALYNSKKYLNSGIPLSKISKEQTLNQ